MCGGSSSAARVSKLSGQGEPPRLLSHGRSHRSCARAASATKRDPQHSRASHRRRSPDHGRGDPRLAILDHVELRGPGRRDDTLVDHDEPDADADRDEVSPEQGGPRDCERIGVLRMRNCMLRSGLGPEAVVDIVGVSDIDIRYSTLLGFGDQPAVLCAGDPRVDVDEPRPGVEGVSDFAGADVP